MIEFFPKDFHLYGPRAMSVDQFIINVVWMVGALITAPVGLPLMVGRKALSGAVVTFANTDGEAVTSLLDGALEKGEVAGHLLYHFEHIVPQTASYVSISLPELGLTEWADLEGTPNARSGAAFALGPRKSRLLVPFNYVIGYLIGTLPAVPLSPVDGADILNFTRREVRTRYV
jgi:hypothetical protein